MPQRSIPSINTIIIHCAATPNGRYHTILDIEQWHGPSRIRKGKVPFLRREHLRELHEPHLKHVGYHYVIRTDGTIDQGRALKEMGAHAYRNNAHSIGICLIGTDKFTTQQWASLDTLVTTLETTLKTTKVCGHNELTSLKTCPGFSVSEWRESNHQPNENHVFRQS